MILRIKRQEKSIFCLKRINRSKEFINFQITVKNIHTITLFLSLSSIDRKNTLISRKCDNII